MTSPSLCSFRIALLLSCFIVAGSSVLAQNIVVDPGFENAVVGTHTAGQTTGNMLADFGDGAWTTTLDSIGVFSDALSAKTGSQSAISETDSPAAFQQTLATTPGQIYELSFFAAANNNVSNPFDSLTVTFDGSTVVDLPNGVPGPPNVPPGPGVFGLYQQYTVGGLLASSSSTVLSFTVLHALGTTAIDDVSVTAVPEPGSLALILSMTITGARFLARRRKQARKAA